MELKITNRQLIKMYNAIENASDVDFDSYLIVHDLALNKAALETRFEALKLLDKPCLEYRKYTDTVNKLRNEHCNDKARLLAEIDKLNSSPDTIAAIDKENARRTAFEEELDKVVTVKNIRKISRLNPAGEPSIRGTSSKALAFILAIEPLFATEEELETAQPAPEQKKKK
jgi:hypothetical protein